MSLEEYKGVAIFAQQVDNKLSSIAFELIGKAHELAADLGTDVTAVVLGKGIANLADELGEYGADKVVVIDDPAQSIGCDHYNLRDFLKRSINGGMIPNVLAIESMALRYYSK